MQFVVIILMQLYLSSFLYVTFITLRKSTFIIKEALPIIFLNTLMTFFSLSFIVSPSLASMASNLAMIIIMTIAGYMKIKMWTLSAVYPLIVMVVFLLSANFSNAVLAIFNTFISERIPFQRGLNDSIIMTVVYITMVSTLAYFISRWLGYYFYKNVTLLDVTPKKKLARHLFGGACTTLVVIFIFTHLRYELADPAIIGLLYTLVVSIGFGSFLFTIFIFTEKMQMELIVQQKDDMLKNLQNYTERQDAITLDLRSFKHDHKNMLLALSAHIKNNDWTALRERYDLYVQEFTASLSDADALFDKLKTIKIPEMASLLLAKHMQAQQQKIDMVIEVYDPIPVHNGHNVLDLCRMMGIFVDNAIEACNGVDGAQVRFLASSQEGVPFFVVENTCLPSLSIADLNKKRFSTKGGERGLGLSKAAQIVAQNDCIHLSTNIDKGVFVQRLLIYDHT